MHFVLVQHTELWNQRQSVFSFGLIYKNWEEICDMALIYMFNVIVWVRVVLRKTVVGG